MRICDKIKQSSFDLMVSIILLIVIGPADMKRNEFDILSFALLFILETHVILVAVFIMIYPLCVRHLNRTQYTVHGIWSSIHINLYSNGINDDCKISLNKNIFFHFNFKLAGFEQMRNGAQLIRMWRKTNICYSMPITHYPFNWKVHFDEDIIKMFWERLFGLRKWWVTAEQRYRMWRTLYCILLRL